MIYLPLSLQAWNTPAFNDVLKTEIAALGTNELPLQQGLANSSYASADKLSVTILNINNDAQYIYIKAGLCYTGIIAGCNCADDPTPGNENNEYCEVMLRIDMETAATAVSLID